MHTRHVSMRHMPYYPWRVTYALLLSSKDRNKLGLQIPRMITISYLGELASQIVLSAATSSDGKGLSN